MSLNHHVYVVAEFLPVQGQEEELYRLLKNMASVTLENEKNCLKYVVTRQIEHPGAAGASKYKIVSIEEFKDKDAFDVHCQSDYVADFVEKYVKNERMVIQDFNVRLLSVA